MKFKDSSEEDEDIDQYEKDELIVDDEEEKFEQDNTPMQNQLDIRRRTREKRKRRSYREDFPECAEGDLQLLKDKGFHAKHEKPCRLKKGAPDDEEFDEEIRNLTNDFEGYDDRDRRNNVEDENFDLVAI